MMESQCLPSEKGLSRWIHRRVDASALQMDGHVRNYKSFHVLNAAGEHNTRARIPVLLCVIAPGWPWAVCFAKVDTAKVFAASF